MARITHLDGADVVLLDELGRPLPAVDEVRVEPDRAWIALHVEAAREWCLAVGANQVPACAIHSAHDGRLHWRGPVQLACV